MDPSASSPKDLDGGDNTVDVGDDRELNAVYTDKLMMDTARSGGKVRLQDARKRKATCVGRCSLT
eukprot:scaffold188994_cov33-Cyclotella_meneghiniana.AAC.1